MDSSRFIYLIILALIIIAGIVISINTVVGPNYFIDFWDDYYYVFFSNYISQYGFQNILLASFDTEYILVGIPSIIYKLFGVSSITEGAYSMLCLAGTLITVFFIGKLLHNELAGLMSSLTLIFIPLVSAEGATSGDNIAVAFFVSLSVLLFLIGVKSDKAKYYACSGFIGFIGILGSSPLELFVFIFLVPYLIYLLVKKSSKRQNLNTFAFFIGILIAALLALFLGYILQSNPLMYFITNYHNVNYPTSNTPSFYNYISMLFPFEFIWGIPNLLFSPIVLTPPNLVNINLIGFFGYAMLLSVLYLLLKKRYKDSLIPLLWFVLIFVYLSFGTDSLSGGFMGFAERFAIILMPALSLVIGIALSIVIEEAFRPKKHKAYKRKNILNKAILIIAIFGYAFIIINAFLLDEFVHAGNYAATYQFQQIANNLLHLPKNSSIYIVSGLSSIPGVESNSAIEMYGLPNVSDFLLNQDFLYWIAVESYASYKININYSSVFSTCNSLKGDYIVAINNSFYKNEVGMCKNVSLYYSPIPNASIINYVESMGHSYFIFPKDEVVIYKEE